MTVSPEVITLHTRALVVDLHVHPSMKMYLFNKKFERRYRSTGAFNPFGMRTDFPTLHDGGINVIVSSILLVERKFVDDCWLLKLVSSFAPKKWRDMIRRNPFEQTNRIFDDFEKGVQNAHASGRAPAEIARSYSNMQRILTENKMAVLLSLEGAHSLDGKLDNLRKFYDRGVCSLTLAHFYENDAIFPTNGIPKNMKMFGCFRSKKDLTKGLTNFGIQVVDEMLNLGMLIDLTHATPKARQQVYDIHRNHATPRPLVLSHAGVTAYNDVPYNLTTNEIKTVADSGGVIGVIFMNHWLADSDEKPGIHFIVDTMKHLKNTGGIDCVAIGTDFDGFTDPPDDLKDPAGMPRLTDALLKAGLSSDEIEKILGQNALRALKDSWGKTT
ncbi:MAG: dipeptidase [bacterium]